MLQIPRLSLDALKVHNQQSSSTVDTDRNITMMNALDDDGDSDFETPSHYSSHYSPHFEPSLKSLPDRVAKPDEVSLSGETTSNADTVSDMDESFELITNEDTCESDLVDTQEMDQTTMSNITIVPHPALHEAHSCFLDNSATTSSVLSSIQGIPESSAADSEREVVVTSKRTATPNTHVTSTKNKQASTRSQLSFYMISLLLLIIMAAATVYSRRLALDPSSDLAIRQDALTSALSQSSMSHINATSVLKYPTTTGVTSGTTTIGLAFPTAIDVYIAKPDQLFVAFPKAYRSSAYIELLRNGKDIHDFNVTKLIDNVYGLTLKPSDAYGLVHLIFRSTFNPFLNETVKVDLGNRLLHRATYENAARDVQQNIQRDVEDVHLVAKAYQAKLVNNTHSVIRISAYRVRTLRDGIIDTAVDAARQLSLGYRRITNTTTSLIKTTGNLMTSAYQKDMQIAREMASRTRNATSAFGSMLTYGVPRKQDFARARNNSLKLKHKLFNKAVVPIQTGNAPASMLERFQKFGSQAKELPKSLYSDIVAPGISKLRAQASGSDKIPNALATQSSKPRRKSCAKKNEGAFDENKASTKSCSKCAMDSESKGKCNGKCKGRGKSPMRETRPKRVVNQQPDTAMKERK